jgi:single-stranded DNA-binding protein
MIDPKNMITIVGGVIADPELVANGNIAKLRLAVDYAGSEKGTGLSSGYFDVVYYLKDGNDFANKNAAFVAKQISEGKMKKGSQIQLAGRLVQERWQQDNQNRSRVVIVAEAVTYAGSFQKNGNSSDSSANTSSSKPAANSVPDEF